MTHTTTISQHRPRPVEVHMWHGYRLIVKPTFQARTVRIETQDFQFVGAFDVQGDKCYPRTAGARAMDKLDALLYYIRKFEASERSREAAAQRYLDRA